MGAPLQITFHQITPSDSVTLNIQKKAGQLEKFFSRITSIRVVVEPSCQRHQSGNLYHVHIHLKLPHGEISVGKHSGASTPSKNINLAVRDSFKAAKRQLEDYVRIHFRDRKNSKTLSFL